LQIASLQNIELDKTTPYPVYRQLSEALLERIKLGKLRPDDALPEEREMSRQFGISRPTLRKSLKLLENDGYIYKIRGRGVFIASNQEQIDCPMEGMNLRMFGISCMSVFEQSHDVEIVRGAIDYLHENRIQALRINYLDNNGEKEHIQRHRQLLSGLVVYPPRITAANNFHFFKSIGLPFVAVASGSRFSDFETDYVGCNDIDGVKTAVNYFINNGHEKIAFIACNGEKQINTSRRQGYIDAVRELKLQENFITLKPNDNQYSNTNTISNAFDATLQLMRCSDRPTAILAENDITSIGIYNALQQLQIKLPDEVEIIGFGNDPELKLYFPSGNLPISTVAVPHCQMGTKAAEILIDRINNPDLPWQAQLLPTKLIHRETTQNKGGP